MVQPRPIRRALLVTALACVLAGVAIASGAVAAPITGGFAAVDPPVPSRDRTQEPPEPAATAATPERSRPPTLPPPAPAPATPSCAGTWDYAKTSSPVMGWGGTTLRFHVAVEQGLLLPVEDFTDHVVRTLSDPRSWIGFGNVRLQQTASWEYADFTIYLACPWTSYSMCRTGGLDTRRNGYPYTSCRVGNWVVINDNRFMDGADAFRNGGGSLQDYRYYVINHEVGHRLGHGHAHCPSWGSPANVMQQQTLRLEGCVPNGWPNPWAPGNPPPLPPAAIARTTRPDLGGYFFP